MPFPSRIRLALACAGLLAASAQAQGIDPPLRMSRELAPAAPPVDAATRRRAPLTLEGPDRGSLFLRADRLEGTRTLVEASGKVELRARRETVLADHLTYDLTTDEIVARGNVVLRQGNDYVAGPELVFRRNSETGHFESPRFEIGENNARGDAARVTFVGPDRYDILRGRVTTCIAPREDWYLRADSMEIDNEKKVGLAREGRLDFMGVTLLYSPWLEFPLSNERKSGFLTPTFGSSGTRGFDFALPYYFNLAPNYDATITPRIMTKRGLQLGGELRYLFDAPMPNKGELNLEVLPEDRQIDATRWLYSWRHNHQFTPWLAGYVNLNKVSDDKYFVDLSERVAITSQSTLPREGGLAATFGPLSLLARAQKFQTLQDPNAPITPPYDRVPHIAATLAPVEWGAVSLFGNAEYARFERSGAVEGDRTVVHPTLEWRQQGPAWFVAGRAGVHARQYALENAVPGLARRPDVVVPIASLDAGLVFEREWRAFGTDFIQTLEPRAFYVYVPFREQNRLPVFDTALDDFNFLQLFQENRYVGNDRIGDADQLTLAVTSRLLDASGGGERMRFAVGQRFYFEDQRVTLPNEAPRSASTSDVLIGAEGRLSDAWLMNALVQFNLDSGDTERLNLGARWNPEPGKVIAASWRYTRKLFDPANPTSNIKQFDVAAQWPITGQWTLLARWNYSIVQSQTLEALVGFEYNADCWVLRAVLHRLRTATEEASTSVYVQLELTGLARLGTSPLDLLKRSVPGFVRANDPVRLHRDAGIDPYPEF